MVSRSRSRKSDVSVVASTEEEGGEAERRRACVFSLTVVGGLADCGCQLKQRDARLHTRTDSGTPTDRQRDRRRRRNVGRHRR